MTGPESANQTQPEDTYENGYTPVVPARVQVKEVTWRAIILGAIIAVVFGVANAYLGLKFGMTVSASIPAAVISMAILTIFFRRNRATVLENNIVQTIGSCGESLAAGIIFTIPAFFIWAANDQLVAMGYDHQISRTQIFFLSMLGGTLGILMMIPLRKYLVHREHGNLTFPEGTACAEIIVAGDEGGQKAKLVFGGIGLGALYKVGYELFKVWPQSVEHHFKGVLKGGIFGADATPALLGVGFIIGPRIASYMFAGAVLGYLGIGPLLSFVGNAIPGTIIPPGTVPLDTMDANALRGAYIKYLGVGAVAVGGFVSLFKSLPVIISSFSAGFKQITGRSTEATTAIRTQKDLSMTLVLGGVLLVVLLLVIYPATDLGFLGALIATLFGFFFVVVAARIVGIVGSSSSPVSGMTIATLLVTALILINFGTTGISGMITTMSVGTVVCIAVCMSGDIAQDLKTGYLLGATPWKQQATEFIGLLFPALAMGATLYWLEGAFGFVQTPQTPDPLLAPQANVMATIVSGVMNADLPWAPILVGAMIAAAVELLGISSLPFAIGLYLPLTLSTPIMAGGLIAWGIKKVSKSEQDGKQRSFRGILFASGMVAGDALIGVFAAILIGSWEWFRNFYSNPHPDGYPSLLGSLGDPFAIAAFAGVAVILWRIARRLPKAES